MTTEPTTWLPTTGQYFLHEIARDRVNAQLDSASQLDGKIQSIVGFAATFAGIALATLAVRDKPVSDVSWGFLGLGIVCFVIILALSAWGYTVRGFNHGPDLSDSWSHAQAGYSEEKLYAWAADVYTKAYKKNKPLIGPKILAVWLGMAVLLLEIIALGIAVANEL